MENNPEQFYDTLAPDYDGMTGYEHRFANERSFFHMLADQYDLKTALDAGCGTGFHSILLAQIGLQVTATDISENMLAQTKMHTQESNVQVETISASFIELSKAVHKKFDSVLCLGNSLAHILTETDLNDTLKSFYEVLHFKGILVLQLLNYDRIMTTRQRILNTKRAGEKTFIRFYDYEKDFIRFNILIIEKNKEGMVTSMNSIKLRPWTANDVVSILHYIGYSDVRLFGSLGMDAFDKRSSKDLVVTARRSD